ncbi:hypothetical protein KBB96_13090 [Luteolibacter ambystomatis]|uniref:Uncharacterized protein n=1 Tax=Luteolibacter ambystomatis TaxID=2824561 RepID=A0A975G6Q5_9BACT|nr:hypothetical protein [Luteolibacter ambystomatis]QUE49805.1 hypothetical protein KBB96_13090 [Luteolibacter ambystomatis]
MTTADLARSVATDSQPPAGLTDTERCLWLAKAGKWHEAHDLCQELGDQRAGAWIHAWLHREEGDFGNAGYWYARAGKSAPANRADLAAEWEQIASALLD